MAEGPEPIPVRFWRSTSGREPVREWLQSLSRDDKRVLGRDLAKVQFGWPVGMPLCRPLGSELWEVRSSLASRREARVLFGFYRGMLIALHAFIKKTRKNPPEEMALARQRWKELTK